MADFVQLWVYLSSTPLFGLTATLTTYVLAQAVYERLDHTPIANPVLWSVVIIGSVLWLTRTPYPTYFAGAQFVHVMLGPAVVALAWPLYQRAAEVRRRGRALVVAALVGGTAAAGSAVGLAWMLGLPPEVVKSLAPKSVTAPVAMGIAEQLGGVPALAALFAVLTGLVGALSARYLSLQRWACPSGRCADLRSERARMASALRGRSRSTPMPARTRAGARPSGSARVDPHSLGRSPRSLTRDRCPVRPTDVWRSVRAASRRAEDRRRGAIRRPESFTLSPTVARR